MKWLKPSLLIISLVIPSIASAYDRITGEMFASRSEVFAENGMAATSQPLATQVALDILKKGGSAVDAAIAANAVLGLVEPTGCGIGGDLYAIVWQQKDQKLHGLNASGRSPASLTLDMLKAKAEGKYKGRKPTARNKTDMVLMALKEGLKPTHIIRELGISKTSYYRIVKEAS